MSNAEEEASCHIKRTPKAENMAMAVAVMHVIVERREDVPDREREVGAPGPPGAVSVASVDVRGAFSSSPVGDAPSTHTVGSAMSV
jgi:hypothetical protein